MECLNHIPGLMLDSHANLVVQKLMEVINKDQRTKLLVLPDLRWCRVIESLSACLWDKGCAEFD
ncbi:putative armadillo-like helical protein [Dioscorea sansibarensis]